MMKEITLEPADSSFDEPSISWNWNGPLTRPSKLRAETQRSQSECRRHAGRKMQLHGVHLKAQALAKLHHAYHFRDVFSNLRPAESCCKTHT